MLTRDTTVARLGALRHSHNLIEHHEPRAAASTLTTTPGCGAGRSATAHMRMRGNHATADVTALRGANRPTSSTTSDPNDPSQGSLVILPPVGSDLRDDTNAAIGRTGVGTPRCRTIARHIAASRNVVDAASMRRDPHAPVLAHTLMGGDSSEPQRERFSVVSGIGADASGDTPLAIPCAIRGVESVPGVLIDEFTVPNFAEVSLTVNLRDNAPICTLSATKSPRTSLHVHGGYKSLGGTPALAEVRVRTGIDVAEGSRAHCIRCRDQVAAAAHEMITTNPLAYIAPFLRFLDAATRSIHANPELAAIAIRTRLAFNLTGVSRCSVTSRAAPSTAGAADRNPVGHRRVGRRRSPLPRPQSPERPAKESSHVRMSLPSTVDAR